MNELHCCPMHYFFRYYLKNLAGKNFGNIQKFRDFEPNLHVGVYNFARREKTATFQSRKIDYFSFFYVICLHENVRWSVRLVKEYALRLYYPGCTSNLKCNIN